MSEFACFWSTCVPVASSTVPMTRPEAHNGAVLDKKRLKTIEAPVEASSVNRLETTEGKLTIVKIS